MSSPLAQLKPATIVSATAAIPKHSVWHNQVRGIDNSWPASLRQALLKIGDEIKLYEQAFSAMAKRNVAMSIHEQIEAFERAWKRAYAFAPLPKLLTDLDEAARKEAGLTSSVHRYKYVSCVGYGVLTGKFDENLFKATWSGTEWDFNNLVGYSGGTGDKVDSTARCFNLRLAIDAAYNHYTAAHGADPDDDKTLKIFMAPEFFFRGRQGAYDISYVSEIFDNLRTFTRHSRFKDWLFVFGTVIGASFDDRLACRRCRKVGASNFVRTGDRYVCRTCPPGSVFETRLGARIDNVALIQKGGEDDLKNAHVIEKEYVSHIDFRRFASPQALQEGKTKTGFDNTAILNSWNNDRRIEIRGRVLPALSVPGSRDGGGSSTFTDERMGGSIFTIDGIKFGLEICLDHLKGRIPSGTGIQIQLVPSAGAHIDRLTCVTNGIGFNVDGLTGKSKMQVNSPGTPTKVKSASSGIPGGGNIDIFPRQAIPYP